LEKNDACYWHKAYSITSEFVLQQISEVLGDEVAFNHGIAKIGDPDFLFGLAQSRQSGKEGLQAAG
jgi:hypothetical protein